MRNLPKAVKDALNKKKKNHKYGAKRTICLHGHDHDSQKEAMWCVKLHQMQKERQILQLMLQPKFPLDVHKVHICDHYPDFSYLRITPGGGSVPEVLEVKGMKMRDWIIKHKLFMAIYPTINYVVV